MKLSHGLTMVFFLPGAITSQAALGIPPHPMPPPGSINAPAAANPVNYVLSVTWKNAAKGTNSLQLVTCEGSFELDTISGTTKLDEREIPNTVKLSGSLTSIDENQGRMQLFIGRTVPYVTSSFTGAGGKNSSSYSQLSVGLQSSFVVTYGEPLRIQSDDNGEVILLVKRGAQ